MKPTMLTRSQRIVVYVVAVGLLLALGRSSAPSPQVVAPKTDTVPPAAMVASLEALRITNGGLMDRIRAHEARGPEIIVRTDTVVTPPDTVFRILNIDAAGRMAYGVLVRRDSLWAPEIHAGIDVSDCDHGLSVEGGLVVCDRARLGHAELRFTLGTETAIGLGWTPSFRSTWDVFVGYDGRGFVAQVSKGLRLF